MIIDPYGAAYAAWASMFGAWDEAHSAPPDPARVIGRRYHCPPCETAWTAQSEDDVQCWACDGEGQLGGEGLTRAVNPSAIRAA
jgi:hypothetical protein